MPASKAKSKVKARASAKPKTKVLKPVLVKKHEPPHVTKAPPKHESFFERLLREKAERHAHQQAQNAHGHQPHNQSMPANHARYSKFAGPRRRAS